MKILLGPYPKSCKTKRKINIRIDKYDTWSMDSTLALIILPMLKQLKATKHGAPYTDDVDAPANLSSKLDKKFKPENGETDKNWFKRWDWILNEMIWTFEQQNKNWENKFYSGKSDILWQAFDKEDNKLGEPVRLKDKVREKEAAYFQLVNGPNHTFKVDRKGMQRHQERMNNGYRLFGKYYQALWD